MLTLLLELLLDAVEYFPWYVMLVLIPMLVRTVVERLAGIEPETFEFPPSMAFETAFRSLVLTSLYYPLFEELVFRGAPLYLFGPVGLVVGSIVWVLMHPSWQLQYLYAYSTSKKLLFTLTTVFYYSCNAVFYGMMWLAGDGLVAILYHVGHNLWLTASEIIQEEMPRPRLRKEKKEPMFVMSYKYVRRKSRGFLRKKK